MRSDLVLLFRTSSWKNLTLLGHPDLIESESLDSIVKALHHRPPDGPIDDYVAKFPFAPTFSSNRVMLHVDHPISDIERAQVSLGFSVPSWLGGAPTSPQIVIKRKRICRTGTMNSTRIWFARCVGGSRISGKNGK